MSSNNTPEKPWFDGYLYASAVDVDRAVEEAARQAVEVVFFEEAKP